MCSGVNSAGGTARLLVEQTAEKCEIAAVAMANILMAEYTGSTTSLPSPV
jgi:hypothetical protein